VKQGAHVIISSRTPQKLEHAVQQLETHRVDPSQCLFSIPLDVTDYAATQKAVDLIVNRYGVPHFLINCAGFARPGYLDELPLEHYREMMDVNFFGTLHTTKAIVPHFKRAKRGHLVQTSSMAGFLGLFGYTGYCASKYAVIGFAQALRQELKPFNIRVTVLCPPNTRTPGLDKENQFKPKEVLQVEEKVNVVDAARVSKVLLEALPKNRFMCVPTFDGRLAYSLSRFFPGVLDLFLKRPSPRGAL
jgi:3-dehydrosphinganine reductase